MKINLGTDVLQKLRREGKITEQEVAYLVDDLLIAENVIDGAKRVLPNNVITLENKRILKG